MQLHIKNTASGFGTREYEVQAGESVWGLKKRLALDLKVHPSQVTLIFGGNKLSDHRTFGDLCIFNESTLHMFVKHTKEVPEHIVEQIIPEPIPKTDTPIACCKWGETMCFISEEGEVWIPEHSVCIKLQDITSVVQVNVSEHLMCVLNQNGELFTWGWNQHGQLGQGTRTPLNKPAKIENLPPVSLISCGTSHCVAVDYHSNLWVWGNNMSGQCGIPEEESCPLPKHLQLATSIKSVDCGAEFTALLDLNHLVYTFGSNFHGQLGVGDTVDRHTPTPVPNLENVTDINAGVNFMFAIVTGGYFAWGNNFRKQLGLSESSIDGSSKKVLSPVFGSLPQQIHSISAADSHSTFLDVLGDVWVGCYRKRQNEATNFNFGFRLLEKI